MISLNLHIPSIIIGFLLGFCGSVFLLMKIGTGDLAMVIRRVLNIINSNLKKQKTMKSIRKLRSKIYRGIAYGMDRPNENGDGNAYRCM